MRITSIGLGYTVCFLIVWRLLRLYKVKRNKNKINDVINKFDDPFLDGVYVIPRITEFEEIVINYYLHKYRAVQIYDNLHDLFPISPSNDERASTPSKSSKRITPL